MRIKDLLVCEGGKDGGPESKVWGFWLVQAKSLFTVAILRFDEGSREVFHSHAFNSISWVLSGELEEHLHEGGTQTYRPSLKPVRTWRDTVHKVYGLAPKTWVLTFRGPWVDRWYEVVPERGVVNLTHNRVEV